MQTAQISLLLTALAAAGVAYAQNNFSVNTPTTLITCQPYNIQWTGGVAPFFPLITQSMQVSQIIKAFPQTSANNYLWTVDLAAGTPVTIAIGDSAGATAASSPVTIVAGAVTNCPASSGSGSSSTSAISSASSALSSISSSVSSSSSSVASSSSRAATSSSSAPTASSPTVSATQSSAPNGASSIRSSAAVVAGFVGMVAAALA